MKPKLFRDASRVDLDTLDLDLVRVATDARDLARLHKSKRKASDLRNISKLAGELSLAIFALLDEEEEDES